MPVGRRNKFVTFQGETRTDDSGGGYSLGWTDTLKIWAEFRPERGRERVEAGRLAAPLGGWVRVESTGATRAITESHRIIIDGESFQIRSIANEDQRNRELTMTVEKQVAT